ncbi:MAG: FG-GAP repeat protein [Planctomycetota bacterium]
MFSDPYPQQDGLFGRAVHIVDLNGDGYGEVLVGAPGKAVSGNAEAGQLLIRVGPVFSMSSYWIVIEAPLGGPKPNAEFGYDIATGDFDFDGSVDVAIGVPGAVIDPGRCDQGEVVVLFGPWRFPGSPHPYRYAQSFQEPPENRDNVCSDRNGDRFGARIAAVNPNNDPYDDLVVGSPGSNCESGSNTYKLCGQAYVYWGDDRSSVFLGPPIELFHPNGLSADRIFGWDVGGGNVVDVETTGTQDVLVAAYNRELPLGKGNAGDFVVFRDYRSITRSSAEPRSHGQAGVSPAPSLATPWQSGISMATLLQMWPWGHPPTWGQVRSMARCTS